MSKAVKKMIVDELTQRFSAVDEAVIISCSGLDAAESLDFRQAIREAGASLSIVKNSLARRVFSARGLEFDTTCFEGSTAVVFGETDAVTCSKVVADWRKKNKKDVPLKGGILDGEVLSGTEAERLTDLPSVLEIKQMLVSAIAGPLTAMVSITNNVLTGVPLALQAIADKNTEGDSND